MTFKSETEGTPPRPEASTTALSMALLRARAAAAPKGVTSGVGVAFAGGEGEDDVAVIHGVGRAYGHGEAVMGHLCDLVGLLLGEGGVGGDDGQGCVA